MRMCEGLVTLKCPISYMLEVAFDVLNATSVSMVHWVVSDELIMRQVDRGAVL